MTRHPEGMLASLATLGAISHYSAMHTSSMPLFAGENSEVGVVWEPRPPAINVWLYRCGSFLTATLRDSLLFFL
ncbi:hypothetical protein Q4508_13065 [Amphritea sp. 2_MG-2023]|uniref:hypothetical protein n=1 Tax=Amphritea TaxID=515417 RepID=UPI001C072308|nr:MULTISPECIES: hypothetical protein [Amphritea]MBU2964260.1 hypothetical protein [Amphritea atlantica]MDO6419482.1 hypothetical protein [Amphritea sp. 2_MG-2023]